jgi:hypothetical protein
MAIEIEVFPSQVSPPLVEDLIGELSHLGYEATLADVVHLREDGPPYRELRLWSSEHLAPEVAAALAAAGARWIYRRFQRRRRARPGEVKVLLRSDGSVLSRMDVDPNEVGNGGPGWDRW